METTYDMKKLIILLLLPLFSFSQLTLEMMSHINDSQSFKRTMIENGFSMDESSDKVMITYNKNGGDTTPEIVAHYKPRQNEEDLMLTDEVMVLIYMPDLYGENETYKAIYDQVKDECEFVEIRDGITGAVAYYDCQYKNPSKEMLEFEEEFDKLKVTEEASPFLSFQVGFNKNESLHLIYFPAANKSNPDTIKFTKEIMIKMYNLKESGQLDKLKEEVNKLKEEFKDSIY